MNWFCLTKKGSGFRGFGGATLCKLPSSAPGNLLYSHCAQRRLYLQKKRGICKTDRTLKVFCFLFCFVFILGPIWYNTSLRADEIKLWLTPSAKQRRNPCSGLPAVYPDLSTRHDWTVKKGLCFVCRDRQSGWRGIRNALPVIRWVRWGSRTRISALLRRRY